MAYKITVQPSGHSFDAGPDEPVVTAALEAGVNLSYGCRNGSCGSCMGRLVSGEIEYPQDGLPPAITAEESEQGQALFCQARPRSDLVIEAKVVELGDDVVVKTLPVKVHHFEELADDVRALYLQLPAGERLQFQAGQWIEFLLKDGSRRGFSIANAPHDDDYIELHVRHVPGGRFTDYVFNKLKPGALLRIEGPRGTFVLREQSPRPVLMMGGGTGFAPLKGILEHAFHVGFERPMHLYWGARARADLYQNELAEQWVAEHPQFRYTPVLSEPQAEDAWSGETGWVHEALLRDYPDLSAYDVYMAGPPVMIEAAKQAFVAHGLPAESLFYDSFDYDPSTLKAIEQSETSAAGNS